MAPSKVALQKPKVTPGVTIQRLRYVNRTQMLTFGTGKTFRYYHINTICEQLDIGKSVSFTGFHAFTGCDYDIFLW
jgi:hypothetical protein